MRSDTCSGVCNTVSRVSGPRTSWGGACQLRPSLSYTYPSRGLAQLVSAMPKHENQRVGPRVNLDTPSRRHIRYQLSRRLMVERQRVECVNALSTFGIHGDLARRVAGDKLETRRVQRVGLVRSARKGMRVCPLLP